MVTTAREIQVKPGYKLTEVGVIPEDWDATPLTGLAAIQHGYGFQSQYFKPFGKYRLTTPGHFHETGGFRDVGEKQKFYEGPLPDGYLLSEGDLIVAMTEQADGLLGSAAIVPIGNTYLHNQRLGKIKVLSPNLSIRFLYRVFNSNNYRAKVRETAAGTKVKHTSPSKLLEIPIPLPSTKAEQEAISTVFSDTDTLIECLEKLIAKKRDIKQATMQQLLTGKSRLSGFDREWKAKKLGEVAEVKKGQLITESMCIPGNVPVIAGGKQPAYFHNKPNRLKRTITISASGANAGYISLHEVPIFASDCSTIEDGNTYSIRYIYYQLQLMQEHIYKMQSGGAQPHIHPRDLSPIEIQISNLDEQQAIATVLTDMDTEIAILEQKREKTRALKQGMMQELLTGRIRLL